MSEPTNLHMRATLARLGLGPGQLDPYDDPERGMIYPIQDPETHRLILRLLVDLWERGALAPPPTLDEVQARPQRVTCVRCRREIVRYQTAWAPADPVAEFACPGVLDGSLDTCRPGRVTNAVTPAAATAKQREAGRG